MAPVNDISIVPLVVALSIRVTLLLQLNGILLKWETQQISQNTATEAAKQPFSHYYFHPGQPGWNVHMSPVNRDPGRRDRDQGLIQEVVKEGAERWEARVARGENCEIWTFQNSHFHAFLDE